MASDPISDRIISENAFLSYFNAVIEKIWTKSGLERHDWYSNCLSRNPRRSDLMKNMLITYRLENMSSRSDHDDVTTDRFSVYVSCKYFVKSKKIKFKFRPLILFFRLLRPFINLIFQSYQLILRAVIGSLLGFKKPLADDYHLIDTFVYGSRDIECLLNARDRHFPDLGQTLHELQKPYIIFPTLIHVRSPMEFWNIVKASQRTSKNVLIKEQLLGFLGLLRVYKRALASSFGLFRLAKICEFDKNFPLLIADFYSNLFSSDYFQASITEIAVENLRTRAVRIKTALIWYENQPIDKAICYSLRKYHSVDKIVGYQGYIVPQTFVCKRPFKKEIEASFGPDMMAYSVKKQLAEHKGSGIPMVLAPPFRFSRLFAVSLPNNRSQEVLIVLPISDVQASALLKLVLIAVERMGSARIIIKPHPSNSIHVISGAVRAVNKNIEELEVEWISASADIYKYLHTETIVFSAASSFCFEAVALNMTLGIVCGSAIDELVEDPMSEFEGEFVCKYRVCETSEAIAQTIFEREKKKTKIKLDDLFLAPSVGIQIKFYEEVFGE